MTMTSRNHLKLSLLSMLAIGPGLLLNSALGPIQHLIQKEFGIENTMTFSPTIMGMVTLALFIPCGPILKHRIGIRTSYLISMVVFVFGSLLAALSMDMYWMTISRFLQGMATGVMLMIMIPTLVLSFPIDKRNLALAVLLLGFLDLPY